MNMREASKGNFTSSKTAEDIQLGCLQRIADATEKMATNFINLQNDRDYYKKLAEERFERISNLERRIASYKGVITKIKSTEVIHGN